MADYIVAAARLRGELCGRQECAQHSTANTRHW
jgi:hypothetical protein